MRWIGLLLILAILLAATACEEEDAVTDEAATPTVAVEEAGTPAPPVATVDFFRLATGRPIEEEEAQRLRSLAPTQDEVGAAFPDLAPFEQELRGDLGQEFEHVDLEKHGFVAGYVVFYRAADESRTAYATFALFDEAKGASGSFQEMLEEEEQTQRPGTSTFNVEQGDEAHGIIVPASQDDPAATEILLRQDRVVAFLVILHSGGEDRREGMRLLARDVAANIEDAQEQ